MACGLQTWISCLQSMDCLVSAKDHVLSVVFNRVHGKAINKTNKTNKQTKAGAAAVKVNTPAMIDGIRH